MPVRHTMTATHLAVVTIEGEVVQQIHTVEEARREIQRLTDLLHGAQRDINTWRVRYADLVRDKDQEAQDHKQWPAALRLFQHWKRECNHPNSEWTTDRFWQALPMLTKYGEPMCTAAIEGCAHDHYTTTRRNGTIKHHDGWDLIFRSADKFEEFVNRCPRERLRALIRGDAM